MRSHLRFISTLAALSAVFCFAITTAPTSASAAEIPLPASSGVANVRDYGAKGDGVTDDTAAIGKAISENINKSRYRANPMIYFPKGTYLVSGPIEGRVQSPGVAQGKEFSAGWLSMVVLIGESREGTVIKLKDRAPGYGDPAAKKWVIATGSEGDKRDNFKGGGNRAFRHGILNLTVDVGAGNPGAVAIDFVSSNRGGIDGVTLRAAPGSGHTAIDLTRWWPGPAMVLDVKIEGFAKGIALDHYQYGMTFENIQMSGQREIGVANNQNVVTMRKVSFAGTVPFYKSTSSHGMLVLLDSKLVGTGTQDLAAISSAGTANLQRVSVSGYGTVLDDTSKAGKDLPASPGSATLVAMHNQGTTISASGKPATWLGLPIEDIPVTTYPALASGWTDGGDTGASLQAAIDSGAECIFIKPVKSIKLTDTLILRGKTRLIMGLNAHIVGAPGKRAIRIDNGTAPVVAFEHLYVDGGIEQASNRTFMLKHGDIGGLSGGGSTNAGESGLFASGPGKTHIIDVIGRNYHIGPQHTFWARQLNAEFGSEPLFTNSGTSWILGFKMESSSAGSKDAPLSTPSLLNKSGKLEVLGGLLYTLGNGPAQAPKVPAFTVEKGRIAVSYRTNGRPGTYYSILLREGTLAAGKDLTADKIKTPATALITN